MLVHVKEENLWTFRNSSTLYIVLEKLAGLGAGGFVRLHVLAMRDFYHQPKRHHCPCEIKGRVAESVQTKFLGRHIALDMLLEGQVSNITAASIS